MKVYIDNIPIVNPLGALNNPTITLREKTETGEIGFSFTGDLEFSGQEYDYIYNKLVTDPNALVNKVLLKFENDCCAQNQVYEFYITAKSLKWCEGKCELSAAAVEKSFAEEKLTCLKNTLVYDNWNNFTGAKHPRMVYCNELRPSWMHYVMIFIALATLLSLNSWLPLIAVIAVIINFVNGIIAFCNNNFGTNWGQISFNGSTTIDQNLLNQTFNSIISYVVGCGRKHPSPLVRGYIINVCSKCGLNFVSSILNNPGSDYYETVYMNAPVIKGVDEYDTTTYWRDENRPLLSGAMLLDQMKSIFNAEYKIQGNNLVFERRDYFIPSAAWLDLTTYPKVNSVCWQWSAKQRYSYGTFYYQKDGINWVGSEAVDRWGDIIDWNVPYSSLQKGELRPLIPFAACRFRDDGIDDDVISFFKNFPWIGGIIKNYNNVIIMNSDNCFTPMLLIWDNSTPVSDAKVKIFYPPGNAGVGLNECYNYPYWFKQGYPGNMYDRFWYIEDPRVSGYQGKDFTAEVVFDCDLLSAVDLTGIVKTSLGNGKVKEISINFANNTMQITGSV